MSEETSAEELQLLDLLLGPSRLMSRNGGAENLVNLSPLLTLSATESHFLLLAQEHLAEIPAELIALQCMKPGPCHTAQLLFVALCSRQDFVFFKVKLHVHLHIHSLSTLIPPKVSAATSGSPSTW